MSRMASRSRLVLGAAMLLFALPALALGHGGGMPWIWLEEEQVMPGRQFHVLVVDYAPYSTVELHAQSGSATAAVGSIATEGDGHGEGDLALPADFPLGYAELVGRDPLGGEGMALIQVGDTPGIGPPPPLPQNPAQAIPGQSAGQGPWWQDPSVLTLGAMLSAAAAGLLYLVLVRRRTPMGASMPQAQSLSLAGPPEGSPARRRRKRLGPRR
jgi:hypothetical protein